MSNFRIIYTRPEDGGVSIIVPAPGVSEADAAASVPEGVAYEVVDVSTLPAERTFRDAWEKGTGCVNVNVGKAKGIAHDKRRAKRAAEFAPLDVEATIPAKASQAEAARQAIRDKHAQIQNDIDACTTCEQLKAILETNAL